MPERPNWDVPFPEKTAAAVRSIAKAAAAAKEKAEPVTDPIKRFIKKVTFYENDLSGRKNRTEKPIRPREGPNHFDIYYRQRILAREEEQRKRRELSATGDPPVNKKTPVRSAIKDIFSRATGFDKEYTEIQYFTLRDRSDRNIVPLDNTIHGQEPQSKLEDIGSIFLTPRSAREQSRVLQDAVTIFELQHPPKKISRRRRRRNGKKK